jgi:hypothetical protein
MTERCRCFAWRTRHRERTGRLVASGRIRCSGCSRSSNRLPGRLSNVRGSRASRAHWSASRRPDRVRRYLAVWRALRVAGAIGGTPMAATGTVAIPILRCSVPAWKGSAPDWPLRRVKENFSTRFLERCCRADRPHLLDIAPYACMVTGSFRTHDDVMALRHRRCCCFRDHTGRAVALGFGLCVTRCFVADRRFMGHGRRTEAEKTALL